MTTAEKTFEKAEGEIIKEFGFSDAAGHTHTAVLLKREVESDNKIKKYDWIAQIEGYEFTSANPKRGEALESLDAAIADIATRTPEQYKYAKALQLEFGNVDYALEIITKYFKKNDESLAGIFSTFTPDTPGELLARIGESAAVMKAIKEIGVDFFKYIEKAKEDYAENAINFVLRVAELIGWHQSRALEALSRHVLHPETRHWDEKFYDKAHAEILSDYSIDSCKYPIKLIHEAKEKITQAVRTLVASDQVPQEKDRYTVAKAADVWKSFNKAK